MDACYTVIIACIVLVAAGAGILFYLANSGVQKNIEKNNKAKRDFINSVVPTNGKAEDNVELMSQMKPSDEVMKYVDFRCTANGRTTNGFIAVTKERLIFKTLAIGDSTSSLDNSLANGAKAKVSFRFDVKEETANIPIGRVTSMSSSMQSVYLDATGCNENPGNGKGERLDAYVLSINAQGVVYKLFLGKCEEIASEFSRTFTSLSRDEE